MLDFESKCESDGVATAFAVERYYAGVAAPVTTNWSVCFVFFCVFARNDVFAGWGSRKDAKNRKDAKLNRQPVSRVAMSARTASAFASISRLV